MEPNAEELSPSILLFLCVVFSPKGVLLANQNKERWMQLCEQASTEQDSKKLLSLVTELNAVLAGREARVPVNRESTDGASVKDIAAKAQEHIASSDELVRESNQLIDDTRSIVREHRRSGY